MSRKFQLFTVCECYPLMCFIFLDDSFWTLHVCICLETKARPQQQGLGTRLNSAPCLMEAAGGCRQKIRKQHSDPMVVPQGNMMPFRTLHSSPRLSELMQRNPLPTILGSPSRVRFHVCLCIHKLLFKVWGWKDSLNIFGRSLLCSPRLHLSDHKYSNIVKYIYFFFFVCFNIY